MQGQFTSGTNSIAQRATLAAVLAEVKITYPMKDAFKKRRDMVLKQLSEIPGLKCNTPDGAFYVFPDVSFYFGKKFKGELIKNSHDLSMYLLNEGHVALVSGDAFGDDNCVRISYATSEDKLTEAISRIKKSLAQLN
jgi:aspartate aminotransferase